MKYIIFSDIDGTLYARDRKIHPQTKADIFYAQKNNVELIFATGNGYFGHIKKLVKKFNCNYIITSNGATIFDIKNNKVIYHSTIEKSIGQELVNFANKNKIETAWWDNKSMYFNSYGDRVKKTARMITTDIPSELKTTDIVTNDFYKIEFYTDPKMMEKLIDAIKPYNLQVARIDKHHIEVTNLNTSKGSAIKWITQKFEVDLAKTMGIGDTTNDLTMLATVGHSYAMANASTAVKKQSMHHSSSVEQNGLGEAIQDFLFRNKIGK